MVTDPLGQRPAAAKHHVAAVAVSVEVVAHRHPSLLGKGEQEQLVKLHSLVTCNLGQKFPLVGDDGVVYEDRRLGEPQRQEVSQLDLVGTGLSWLAIWSVTDGWISLLALICIAFIHFSADL